MKSSYKFMQGASKQQEKALIYKAFFVSSLLLFHQRILKMYLVCKKVLLPLSDTIILLNYKQIESKRLSSISYRTKSFI